MDCKKIEFVCTGNICRSPFAALSAIILGAPVEKISSSGIWAENGRRAPHEAIAAAKKFNVNMSSHSAARTTKQIANAGKIIVMEYGQMRDVLALLPKNYEGEVLLLGEFLESGGVEIPDPYGMGISEYEEIYRSIFNAVRSLTANIFDR